MSKRILMLGHANATPQERVMQWALDDGSEIIVLTPEGHIPILPPSERLIVITFPSRWMTLGQRLDNRFVALPALRTMIELISSIFAVDLIHLHWLSDAVLALAKAQVKVPKVVSVWGGLNTLVYSIQVKPEEAHGLNLRIDSLSKMDGLIVEAPLLQQVVEEEFAEVQHVSMIPMGVDTEKFKLTTEVQRRAFIERHRFGIPPDALTFCSPRGWNVHYRHREVMEAFAEAYSELSDDAWLMFVGLRRGGEVEELKKYIADIKQIADNANLSHRVVWIPQRSYDEMPTLFAMTDVVINIPRTDAFPSTLIEACACECQIISADMATYRGSALYSHLMRIPPSDPSALKTAIIEVSKQTREERRRMGVMARQMVLDNYDQRRTRSQLMKFYDRLINGH